MKNLIETILNESLQAKEGFIRENTKDFIRLAEKIAATFTDDHKLMLCGNGGSAADAQHIAAEFVNRFSLERPPLPALALTTDTSILTSIGNDYSYDDVFSKQIKALGMKGDILWAISTSGNSKNILSAVKTAKNLGIFTVGFSGGTGGELAKTVEMSFVVKSENTARIQESHILGEHIICCLVDHILFQGTP